MRVAPTAESAYLFRHGALRDAAYQLIPLSQRSRLHAIALDVLEENLSAGLETAFELADHAREAQTGSFASELPFRELRYLRLAAMHADSKYENDTACRLWERAALHPAASPTERAEAYGNAGVTHWMLGRRPQALRCLGAAIDTPQAAPRCVTFALIERGTLFRDVREHEPATRDLERALEIARRIGDKHLQLRALGNLCTIRDTRMTRVAARELYAPVLKLARETGNLRAVGITEGQIGQACMRSEEFAAAETHLHESISMLRQAGDRLNEAAMLSALGHVFRSRTDGERAANLERAAELYREAIAANDAMGFLFQRSSPLVGLASVYREQGKPAQAREFARQALQTALEVGDPAEVAAASDELHALDAG
jgi:tetratricopeptide (TPR) repeat protein